MRAWKKRLSAIEAELKYKSELDPADFDVALFIEALGWLGMPNLPITAENWPQVLRALTDIQLCYLQRFFEAVASDGCTDAAHRVDRPTRDEDVEIQHMLFRAGFFRQFPRIDFDTPGRTYETLGCIDLTQLTAAELAVLEDGED